VDRIEVMVEKQDMSRFSQQPRLVCLTGDSKGMTIRLDDADAEVTLGRVRANKIQIHNPHASRRHAKIVRAESGNHILVDLGSHNGTFVNDLPIEEHPLHDGDEIRITDERFVFLCNPEGAGAPPDTPQSGDSTPEDESLRTITMERIIQPSDSTVAAEVEDGGGQAPAPALTNRLVTQIEALRSLAEMLSSETDQSILLDRTLQTLLDTFRAERGCILLVDRTSRALSVVATTKGRTDPPVSQTIVRKVAAERVSVLCSDAMADERLGLATSVTGFKIRSVICTPLVHRGNLLGVVYLDSRSLAGEFKHHDLWLLRIMASQIAILVDYFHLMSGMRRRIHAFQEEAVRSAPAIVGESSAFSDALATARRAAASNATILILGESGTGKEVLARSIHRWSPRREEPFVVVNCAALSDQLLQSDLFGHERGAFTGAVRQKLGRLEIANGGTVFLDEVAEMDREMQAKFLRFLQEHEFERLGGTHPIRVDVRILAASNRDIAAEVQAGRFREDLYYRLRVVEVVIPPLRDRRPDIPLLAEAFLREFWEQTGGEVPLISSDAMELLQQHPWKGNIRELRNAIERAVVLRSGRTILAQDLGLATPSSNRRILGRRPAGYREAVREMKGEVIRAALDEAGGRHDRAAAALGLQPAYLSRLMKNLGMR
jgi:Nif-specific regulatory protein